MTVCARFVRMSLFAIALSTVSATAATKTTAATPPSASNEIRITMPGAPGAGSLSWSIVALLTFLTLIPSLLPCMTPFARLLIVFRFLRQALGLQSTPTNQTLIGLALILTFFLMQPVGTSIYTQAVGPLEEGQITAMDALQRGSVPIHHFMVHYVREKDVALFVDLSQEARPHDPSDLSMRILVPAYKWVR
jgi:flagellar biosynthetic protein FliP